MAALTVLPSAVGFGFTFSWMDSGLRFRTLEGFTGGFLLALVLVG